MEILMKSMIRGAVLGLAVMVVAQAAHAQAMSFGVGGGVVVPTGTLSDGTSTGWSGSALVRVQPPLSPVGFQVDAFYTRFGLEGGVDGHSRMLGGTANAVFAFPGASMARPYLIGGVGVYNGQTTVTGLGSSDAQTKFGFNAGAGFDFGLGKAKLYAEGRFHAIMKAVPDATTGDEKTAYMIPLTVGLRF
jgi:outer membrane protein with beta-barrel domain